MPFQLPDDEDPFFKRFLIMVWFFAEFLVEFIFPALVAVFLLGGTVMFCGLLLGIIPDPQKTKDQQALKESRTDSTESVQALDEKTRVNLEMEILEEMLQARRVRMEKLVKSD
ncbi:hypothetical protein P168DRAFT_289421 [Aspergillus campestris IBT 28561]|uniref:Uncharacterized protein n=1 Tax=Aspergillus campestris (strain IBT 28561) TaxID=1392248 RepID=A0A2I1D838_ASPC2|nr:uncharacterized protein P168DRAFT_289421 [Aspergillus campestris IBT 28561]PKY06025.1 hypothetical protein P168DRAFT_289421 [Aspergillus campestris IBT 28561]